MLLKIAALVVVVIAASFSINKIDKLKDTSKINMSSNDIPELLERGAKIQYGKEWDYMQNAYMEQKLALEKNDKDHEARLKLAQIFIKEARVTGEHGHYYPAALESIDKILADTDLDRDMKFLALTTKAGVQLSLHEFQKALETGNEAVLLNPANAQIHGVLVDANVELGNYERAIKLADRMVTLKPDIRSYSRVSYLREIHGDVDGSIEAMKMAATAGYPGYEETAWAMLTLGDLYKTYGDLDKAEKIYNEILETRPDYPFAVGAIGDVQLERGDLDKAEETLTRAMNIIPEVGFYVSMAELYKKQGREDELKEIMKEIMVMLEDDVQSGHNMNLEYAHIYLDILDDPEKALEYAKEEYNKRPENIDVNRTMAEVMIAMNDTSKAKEYASAASKTNSKHPELKEINTKI